MFLKKCYDIYTIGLLHQNGAPQRHLRKFTISSMRDFGVGRKSSEQRIQEEAEYLAAEIGKQNGGAFNPKRMLVKAVSNVISSVVFGER